MAKNSGKLHLDLSGTHDKKTLLIIIGIVVIIIAAVAGTIYSLIGDDKGDADKDKSTVERWYICSNPNCGGEPEMPPWRWSQTLPTSTPFGQDADGKKVVCPKCGGTPLAQRKCPNPACVEIYGEDPNHPIAKCPACGIDLAKWRKEHEEK